MHTLNLGIFAHVDAGKTTLTERLLYAAGVIDEVGSVDAGTTQTDSLPLEQRRGITIKSAVASFSIDGTSVNLIDTPGHPDFIAEVDRALVVLDGAVLVISAVEGVQPQTRILMRALQRLRVPTLLFINKIDRAGARDDGLLDAIAERLTPAVIAMGSTRELGTPAADFTPWCARDAGFTERLAALLAERNDDILGAYLGDASLSYERLRAELVAQTRRGLVHPVFFGSAITGAGVDSLMSRVAELLRPATGNPDDVVSGRVFKIERTPAGERTAYVRMFTGTIRARDRVESARGTTQTVTAISVFEPGGAVRRPCVVAGQIARVSGLRDVQIGDWIGQRRNEGTRQQFAPPTMESVVVAVDRDDRARLRVALRQLAEQDPLIDVRQDDELDELSVSLYGEVQKEVVGSTLAEDFGIDVTFRETTTIYIERPVGTGSALELLTDDANPYSATIGLRIEPAPIGSGVAFRLDVDTRLIPTHIYKTADGFIQRMDQYVEQTLDEGLCGWRVADCVVTMTDCGYYASDGPRKPTRPTERTTATHFRKLTPIVLRRALRQARTVVCDPNMRVHIETPASTVGAVLAAATRLGGTLEPLSVRGDLATVETIISAARVQDLQRALSSVTGGDATVETGFAGYAPVSGPPPIRHRRGSDRSGTRQNAP